MVRRYLEADRSSAEQICIETAHKNLKNTAPKREFLLIRYLNFYIENCPDNCFVAEKDGKASGYVLCCPDSRFFKKEFPKFLKRHGLSFSQRFQCFGDTLIYQPFRKKYPAHLHIDILPEAQRQGFGKLLIETLCEKLKSQGKNGVMLAVSANNTNALKFYKATGFEKILRLPGTYLLGKQI